MLFPFSKHFMKYEEVKNVPPFLSLFTFRTILEKLFNHVGAIWVQSLFSILRDKLID